MQCWNTKRTPARLGALFLALAAAATTSLATPGATQGPAPPPPPGRGQQRSKTGTPVRNTSRLLVFVNAGESPAAVAGSYGLRLVRVLQSAPNGAVFGAASPQAALQALQALRQDSRVALAFPNRPSARTRSAFVPNDPYFNKNTPASGFPGQWYLVNQFVSGRDIRIQGAWNRDLTGEGIEVGLIDDGIQTAQYDLKPNYYSTDSYDFGQNDTNPNPVYPTDSHGTALAGVIAARGANQEGITGAAPYAKLVGLRVDFDPSNPAFEDQFVDATLYRSSGSITRVKVKNHSYNSDAYTPFAAEKMALAASTGAGTIHTYSSGNGAEDAAKQEPQNSPDAIVASGVGSDGVVAGYSNFGANVFVTAPTSGGRSGTYGITTTDRTWAEGYSRTTDLRDNDPFPSVHYTSVFGGTSVSSALVAGVLVLGKQAQSALDTRFAKHLLARTSDVIDGGDVSAESDGGWKMNAAGFRFNQNYGFGLVNADQFTQAAVQYAGVTPLTTESVGPVQVGQGIPDNDVTGVTRTFTLNSTTPLEEVLVSLHVTHAYSGDIAAYLTSPSGTVSRLVSPGAGVGDLDWTFCANAFWGENPAGTWTLQVQDGVAQDAGVWDSFSVTARMGRLLLGASVSGIVYNDLDGNAGRGSNEPKVGGWTIYADYNNNGALDPSEPRTVSKTDGTYLLRSILPGQTIIREVLQSGWRISFPSTGYHSLNLAPGQNVVDKHFLNTQKCLITGRVYHDLNANGYLSTGEPGLQGWTVFADANGDGTLNSGEVKAVTDASGNFKIFSLSAGTHSIREVVPDGWIRSAPASGSYSLTLSSGGTISGRNFGNYQPGTVSGQVFEDANGNGVKEQTESGLSGWVVYADLNKNKSLDTGEPSTPSGEEGGYALAGLKPATYAIRAVVQQQGGWVLTTPAAGSYSRTVTNAGASTGNDFGYYRPGAISGRVFEDVNANGSKDQAEPDLSGWVIYSDANGNGSRDTGEPSTTSVGDGAYSLTGLKPGAYTLRVVQQNGWVLSAPAAGFHSRTLASGETSTGNDFGYYRSGIVSGQFFEDANGNGTRDQGEAGLHAWAVYADLNNNESYDAGEPSALTRDDGSYSLLVKPGTHTIRAGSPPDQMTWAPTTPPSGSYSRTVDSGGSSTGNDFGYYRPASLSGLEFEDVNGNGSKDEGEPGLSGWVVYLDLNGNESQDGDEPSTTTGQDGAYSFTGLKPGPYTVRTVQQNGWVLTTPVSGFHSRSLVSAEASTGNDFGSYQPATISGVMFEDANDSGGIDGDDPLLAGWVVYLDLNGNESQDGDEPSATTGGNGGYSLTGLKPGTYTVRVVPQNGWVLTVPAEGFIARTVASGDVSTDNLFGTRQQ